MNPLDMSLARDLVAHPRWRWEPGMATLDHEWILWAFEDDITLASKRGGIRMQSAAGLLPDLGDPGTVGHLLSFLGEASDQYALGRDGRGGFSVSWSSPAGAWSLREPASFTFGQVAARALLQAWG